MELEDWLILINNVSTHCSLAEEKYVENEGVTFSSIPAYSFECAPKKITFLCWKECYPESKKRNNQLSHSKFNNSNLGVNELHFKLCSQETVDRFN